MFAKYSSFPNTVNVKPLKCGVLKTIKFIFRFEPKLNLFRLFFGLFRETKKHFFRFVSVSFGVSDRYRNNRNKQNFLETNRKNHQKTFSIRRSSKPLIFFLGSNWNKPKLTCFGCFSVCSFAKPKKQLKQTELMVWGIKKVDILTNLLLFRLVFCLFQFFRNTETPCFDIKAKQPKQTSCFGIVLKLVPFSVVSRRN